MGKQSGEAGTSRGEAGCNPKPSKASDNGLPQPSSQPPKCPECGSSKVWRDGLRYLSDGRAVQRWLCRSCGFRFSDSTADLKVKFNVFSQSLEKPDPGENLLQPYIFERKLPVEPAIKDLSLKLREDITSHSLSGKTIIGKNLYTFPDYNRERRVCASKNGAKNSAGTVLVPMEEKVYAEGRAAGATAKPSEAEIKGKIVSFLWELQKQGLKPRSIETYHQYLSQLLKRGADLLNPESVREIIAKQPWSENTKALAVAAYSKFLEVIGGKWEPPKYKRMRKLPFIPLESELNQLISGANKKMATLLQLLKETGMRIGEALQLEWTDIDFQNLTITLNKPEKYGKPRMFKISPTLTAMLNALPRKSERVFGGQNPRNFQRIYAKYRNRMAIKLQNPRLKRITFHTFRHWKATMEYHRTKDILHVMEMLGHRDIKTTMIYTQLISFESDEYSSAVAKSVEEARKLIEAGFEYVCTYQDTMLFRKRK